MARDGFYDDNRGRNFPLLDGLTGKPEATDLGQLPLFALIDFGCTMGLDSGYAETTDSVYLYSVGRVDSVITFRFRSTASGLANYTLVFERDVADALYSVDYVDASTIDESTPPPGCADAAIWRGFLVTGEMDKLAELLGSGQTWSGGPNFKVEPALIRSTVSGYVRSLALANADRVRAETPSGCRPYCWPLELQAYYVRATCLQGDVRFKPGYNSRIVVNVADNAVEFSATQGAGEGEPCEGVTLTEDDGPAVGSQLLSGGPLCNETIRSINGLGGPTINILAGKGVSIQTVPAEHRLTVDVNFNNVANCLNAVGSEDDCEDFTPPPSGDPCDCGDEL